MKEDSPVAAMILKLKKKPEDEEADDTYDVDEASAKAAGKRLRKAVEAKDDMAVYDAVCEVLGLKGLISHDEPEDE